MIVAAGTGELVLDPDELAASDVLDGILTLVLLCSDPELESPFPPSCGLLYPESPVWLP